MHEITIVRDIFKVLEEEYPNNYRDIIKVEIHAGLLSNVQPILIQNAFEAFIEDEPQYADTELEVKLLPIIAHCANCARDFEVHLHRFVCPCGKPSDKIVQGEELQISQVIFANKT
ncbi:hydrogenase maturation nickel metallochaperone HypA [Olivibacter sp. SDN3]|uniref:hydrogenase maturation nickel metallochaperone HypA/HybF n=1 Tax=Olivibacter sp. SDN3 TaxID=2764720 RepID=UPI00165199C5|nr:hydrogenase maturation nickel metallochaperone HypA [Olivibacter sp. SDN3]QNL50877.1 hydrogenase maturation nickel metallochaperone HypA [Olivibacter sp. SDN3]